MQNEITRTYLRYDSIRFTQNTHTAMSFPSPRRFKILSPSVKKGKSDIHSWWGGIEGDLLFCSSI